MFRVMPSDPRPDGTYKDGQEGSSEPYEVVFKVPRLEAHVEGDKDKYTIVLPQYVAEEMRQQAQEAQAMDDGFAAAAAAGAAPYVPAPDNPPGASYSTPFGRTTLLSLSAHRAGGDALKLRCSHSTVPTQRSCCCVILS